MSMSAKRPIALLSFCIYLSTIVSNVECVMSIHVKIRKEGLSLNGPVYSENTRRLVECVYSCLQHTNCKSIGYNKRSAICHLYLLHAANTQGRSGTLLFGHLKEVPTGREKKPPYPPTQISTQHERRIELKTMKNQMKSWRGARDECHADTGILLRIFNESDQATAVKTVNGSGLERVAIGAYVIEFTNWITSGSQTLLFSDWGKGEPRTFVFFAGLSRQYDYKWEAFGLDSKFDGVLCQY